MLSVTALSHAVNAKEELVQEGQVHHRYSIYECTIQYCTDINFIN